MQKPTAPRRDDCYPTGVSDQVFAGRYPVLLLYLVDTKWDDGSPRETSTLSVFIEQGSFKVALNDREMKRSTYITGDSLTGVLDALEACLAEDRADWRLWNRNTKKGKQQNST